MNRRTTLASVAGLLLGALAPAALWAQPASAVFLHRATAANTQFHTTFLDHPLANNNPSAIVLVTPNWNPPGSPGVPSSNPIGVAFNTQQGRWSIVDARPAPIAIGASYNVRVSAYIGLASQGRRHRGTPANTAYNFTDIDDPALNNNPNAVVIVTHSGGFPGDPAGRPHDHAVGVWYNNGTARWSIFNEDGAAMPLGITFNYIAGFGGFVHRALPTNTQGVSTFISHPRTNGRPGALLLATHNWNPGGGVGLYNDSPLGVRYAPERGQWAAFNERFTPNIAFGAAFNVLPLN